MLRSLPSVADANLLIGLSTSDDAAVYRVSEELALVQTIDFFTPIVDDPYLYGQIAVANSLSDVYAMGGTPLTAMNVLCYPISERDPHELAEILRGGRDKLDEAGVPLVGGHSVEDSEPKFGLSVTGKVDPRRVASNAGARAGDRIVLTKQLGTGVITTAAKADGCPEDALRAACRSMAMLNAGAAQAMREIGIGADSAVHAATDITGFGLIGHLYQLAAASGVGIQLDSEAVPALPGALELAAAGYVTRGDRENRDYPGSLLRIERGVDRARLSLMLDPQTSGGLAIVICEDQVGRLQDQLARNGVTIAAVVGGVVGSAEPVVVVR